MTYDLALADRSYSSWSLRIGLLVARFELPVTCHFGRLYGDDFTRLLSGFAPARTVPALRLPEGPVISESLAIAEEFATRFPDKGLWPAEPGARAVARGLAAEMHAGFGALRNECPMNLRVAYVAAPVTGAVDADLRRIEEIWSIARKVTGADGLWLCGAYSIADAFFAPVAARIAGYGLSVSPEAGAYVAAHLADPAFRQWRALGLREGPDQPFYKRDYAQTRWPGPSGEAVPAS